MLFGDIPLRLLLAGLDDDEDPPEPDALFLLEITATGIAIISINAIRRQPAPMASMS
jgi:hypothetical protein